MKDNKNEVVRSSNFIKETISTATYLWKEWAYILTTSAKNTGRSPQF